MQREREELIAGEWAALALLTEGPTHGFAIARTKAPDGEVGKIWTVRRPLVYRALETLSGMGLVRSGGTVASSSGPPRDATTRRDRGRAVPPARATRPPRSLRRPATWSLRRDRRRTPTVADVIRRAVEICDPDDVDQTLGHLEQQLEDDDETITAVENLEERLAWALESTDYDVEDPSVAVASAIALYLSAHPNEIESSDDEGITQRAVRAQWRGDTPDYVDAWLSGR
jgi:DNA-binding PadR family transcriptional regulator